VGAIRALVLPRIPEDSRYAKKNHAGCTCDDFAWRQCERSRTERIEYSACSPDSAIDSATGATPSPPNALCYIIWPADGTVITGGKLWVRMGLRNMGVCPKGFNRPNTGHHHLVLDSDLPPLDQEIPSDRNHLHYGAGETDAHLELPPGKHTLQLLLGDYNHRPHDPPVYSKKITIVVR
jgi:hypothetical protein